MCEGSQNEKHSFNALELSNTTCWNYSSWTKKNLKKLYRVIAAHQPFIMQMLCKPDALPVSISTITREAYMEHMVS